MILFAEIECILYDTQSLKEKRSILKKVITKLRKEYNVSVAELKYQNLWQRTMIGVVTVSNERKVCEQVLQDVMKTIDAYPELERTITNVNEV